MALQSHKSVSSRRGMLIWVGMYFRSCSMATTMYWTDSVGQMEADPAHSSSAVTKATWICPGHGRGASGAASLPSGSPHLESSRPNLRPGALRGRFYPHLMLD